MEAKGDQLMHEADAALKKFSFGAMFGGGNEKYEDASDKYKRAGNAYKASKKCACAGRRPGALPAPRRRRLAPGRAAAL